MNTPGVRLWTIGHGSRPLDEFLALLAAARIECLVDVRAYPASRRYPHFGRSELERSLPAAGIAYGWEGAGLGGRRRPAPGSPNVALRNASFRAYADHMLGQEFRDAVARLTGLAQSRRTAIMCAERLPWHCHRYLISDYLVAHAVPVSHLVGEKTVQEHRLNPVARVRGEGLVYDGATQRDIELGP